MGIVYIRYVYINELKTKLFKINFHNQEPRHSCTESLSLFFSSKTLKNFKILRKNIQIPYLEDLVHLN